MNCATSHFLHCKFFLDHLMLKEMLFMEEFISFLKSFKKTCCVNVYLGNTGDIFAGCRTFLRLDSWFLAQRTQTPPYHCVHIP